MMKCTVSLYFFALVNFWFICRHTLPITRCL